MTCQTFTSPVAARRNLMVSLLAVVMTAAATPTAALAQFSPTSNRYSDDFGASPDSYFGSGRNSFDSFDRGYNDSRGNTGNSFPGNSFDSYRDDRFNNNSSNNNNNSFQLDRMGSPSRDPVLQSRFDDGRMYDNRGPATAPGNRAPRGRDRMDNGQDWNTRYAPVNRPWDVEELPRPPRQPVSQPVNYQPTQPVVKPEPTLREKVEQRYADPKVVRMLQQMNQSSGEALYNEVSQYIDQRHIQPTSYQQRLVNSLESLSMAVQTPSFQQAAGIRPSTQAVQSFQQNISNMAYQAQVQNSSQMIGVIRQVAQLGSQTLQMNPGAVYLEFVYGSLGTLDKFSMLVAPDKVGGPSVGLETNMVGIGVEIEAHPQGLMILKALAGGPAAAATLQRGDIITAVDGRSVAGLTLNQAVDLIAGANGTPVQLQLRRDNMVGDVTIVRRSFDLKSVSEVRMEANNVGYIKLDQFAQTSTKELDEALWSLHNQGMRSLVLDLRGNPGGLLTTSIEISNRFLPSGTIVSTRGRTANDNSQETASHANTWKTPLVVLVDHNSASASEILAAAIQENDRGLIVGERSYGKGTVQTLFPMRSVSSALRLTTAKFYSPDGREMAGNGVTPDIQVTTMSSDRPGNDTGLQTAIRAAVDPRVIDMATKSAKLDGKSVKVIRVEI